MAQIIHDIHANEKTSSFTDRETFALDILVGLSRNRKSIPAIYHYDTEGSHLFDKITTLPEYYPTNCEIETLKKNRHKIADFMREEEYNLVEFGSGNGSKTKIIIEELVERKVNFRYIPIDISKSALEELIADYEICFPDLEIDALIADYFSGVKWLNKRSSRRNMVLFLGSNIGNFSSTETRFFLRNLWITLNNNDHVLIGFDLKKDIELLLDAYNDASGVTADFNLNVFQRINRELGGEFDTSKFRHFSTYEVHSGAMESYLVSLVKQEVMINEISRSFHFEPWEPVHMEYSYKFHEADIESLAKETGYAVVEHMYDTKKYFTDTLWQVRKEE